MGGRGRSSGGGGSSSTAQFTSRDEFETAMRPIAKSIMGGGGSQASLEDAMNRAQTGQTMTIDSRYNDWPMTGATQEETQYWTKRADGSWNLNVHTVTTWPGNPVSSIDDATYDYDDSSTAAGILINSGRRAWSWN